jgi:hypothetical protein
MARFTVPVEKLPPPNSDGNHLFRFRVISSDRNRSSEYSNLITIESKGQIYPLETVAETTLSASVVNVYWEIPSIYNIGASAIGASVLHNHESEWKIHPSDIFVKWDSGTYEYFGRTIDSNISVIKKNGATTLRVRGQVAGYPPRISDNLKFFETDIINL